MAEQKFDISTSRSKNLINITAFTLGLRLSNNENT